MLASTFFDMVLGVDIHWEMLPAPPAPPPAGIPTPLPNPFVGMTFDPVGAAVGIALGGAISAVMGAPFKGPVLVWTAFPAANTGSEAKNYLGVPHILIPPGFAWAPVPKTPKPVIRPGETPDPPKPISPDGDAVIITGSKTVKVMGSNWARLGDLALSCSEPVRLPSSTILPIPKGAPVLVGGPMALDLMAAVMASLRTRFVSDSLHAALSRMNPSRWRNALQRAVCFLTGHPVDVATGRVLTDAVDFDLPGPLPLKFQRVYSSGFASRPSPVGHGWNHTLNQAVWEERGKVVYLGDDGREIEFDVFDLPDHRMRPGDSLHDPMNRLTLRRETAGAWQITDAQGVRYGFEVIAEPSSGPTERAKLREIRSRDGHHSIELTYDRRGNLEWCRDANGRLIGFEHDGRGRLIKVKLPLPHERGWYVHRQYAYDQCGDLTQVVDSNQASYRFEYVNHLLVKETDRAGLSFYFEYDAANEDAYCTRTWGDGGLFDHVIRYDKQNRSTFVTDSLGKLTTYKQNAFGLVVAVIDPNGGETKHQYDPDTLLPISHTDPAGVSLTTTYDGRGNAIGYSGSDGTQVSIAYDERNQPILATDPMGGTWEWRYDAEGHLTTRTAPTGETVRLGWERGLIVWMEDALGRRTTIEYDSRKTPAKTLAPNGTETELRVDELGRVVKTRDATGSVARIQYDSEARVLGVETLAGLVQSCRYDDEGHLVEFRDATRHLQLSYGAFHSVVRRDEGGASQHYEYDTEGRLVRVINERGETHELKLDAAGRVASEVGFDGTERTYVYDKAGRPVTVRTAGGRCTTIEYDAAGRRKKVASADGTFVEMEYRADGELTRAVNESNEIILERDALGRIVRERVGGFEVSRRHGPDGQRTEMTSSLGARESIVHGALGQIESIAIGAGAVFDRRQRIDFVRDPLGQERSRTAFGTLSTEWTFDEIGRPLSRRVLRDGPGGPVETRAQSYQWRGYDQIAAIVDGASGPRHFEHDARGRLTRETQGGRSIVRAHDDVGNLYRSADGHDRRYGRGGRLEEADGARYEYDADGNRVRCVHTDGAVWSYRWGDNNLLREVQRPDGMRVCFEYDAFSRRTAKRVYRPESDQPVRETRFAWDANVIVHELDSERGLVSWYWEPGTFTPIAKEAGGARWSIASDHLGTPTELYDEQGKLAWSMRIDVGATTDLEAGQRSDCPWRWPGQYEDEETGLWWNRYRYFDPQTCTYISPDPIGLNGGTALYAYVGDPTTASDPLGLAQCVHKPSNNPLVDDFARELDDAVQAAAKAVDAGSVANPCARLFQKIRHVPGLDWLARMMRGTAIQQIAESTVKNGPAHQAIVNAGGEVIFNRGSILGQLSPSGNPLRPDVQIVVPHPSGALGPNPVHIMDITTPGQAAAGKIGKYAAPAVGGMTDITY